MKFVKQKIIINHAFMLKFSQGYVANLLIEQEILRLSDISTNKFYGVLGKVLENS